ncbi:protein NLRC5 isoform X2 [Spea bombifrons]|nr:protein NLRC5 isoform X2 [Spea bombifrons]
MEDANSQDEIGSILPQLVDFLFDNVDWFLSKVPLFIPDVDLRQISLKSDDKGTLSALLQELMESHAKEWRAFIQYVCMEGELPMDLETQLLSTVGQDPAETYKEQIVHTLLNKYGFGIKEDASQQLKQMFVEPLIQQVKVHTKVSKPKGDPSTSSAIEETPGTMKISQLFERASISGTHAILLVGMPGTGKTLLMHRICYEWASGGFQQFTMTFLFEFRQLNLISRSVTLKELLFNLFLRPEIDQEKVYQYITENPQNVLIIFDGLDEFAGKISSSSNKRNIDPMQDVPISEMFQNLLEGTVLCGCTVVVTCRSKILTNQLLSLAKCVAEVLGFNEDMVEKYVSLYFHKDELRDQALFHLRENHTLMRMCFVPALCHIVCICLEYMLHVSSIKMQLPQTITQFYVKMLNIFIWKQQMYLPNEAMGLKKFRPEICELCHLALRGLDENKTVFYVEDISEDLKGFALGHGLLSRFDVKKMDSSRDTGYSFVHLSSQEFFASLYLMISKTVTQSSLKQKLSLKSKWNIKYKTKDDFTDNFHIFLSGLSSKECRAFLNELAEHGEVLVQKKQETIIECLVKFADSQLTGPKLIELCHCVYETQDLDLVRRIGAQLKFKYDFKNFRINPVDMTALSLVVNHGPCLVSLDFAGCPMEADCIAVLEKCDTIESLSFRNRKYGDEFVKSLSKCLPAMKFLKKLRLTAGRITEDAATALKQSLLCCKQLQEINLQDNHLKAKEMLLFLVVFEKMEQLKQIDLSNNELNAKNILTLSKAASKCLRITEVQMSVEPTIAIFKSDLSSPTSPPTMKKFKSEENNGDRRRRLSLVHCHLTPEHVPALVEILVDCPHLSDVNLSENYLSNDGICQIAQILPKLRCLRSINLSGNGMSMCGVIYLAECLSTVENMTDLTISFSGRQAVSMKLQKSYREKGLLTSAEDWTTSTGTSKNFSLTSCRMTTQKMQQILQALGRCTDITSINLSDNGLSYQNIKNLLKYLPQFPNLTFLNFSNSDTSPNCALLLAKSVNVCERIKEVDIRSSKHMCLHLQKQQKAKEVIIRLNHCKIGKNDVGQLVTVFQRIPNLIEVSMCMNELSEEGILNLLAALSSCRNATEVNARLHPRETIHIIFSPGGDMLQSIRLAEYNFQAEQYKKLLSILEDCSNLTHFKSQNNEKFLEVLGDFLTVLSRKSCMLTISNDGQFMEDEHVFLLMHTHPEILASIGAIRVYKNKVILDLKDCTEHIHTRSDIRFQGLQSLRFNHCGLQDKTHFLNTLMTECTSLTELNLSHNFLGDDRISVIADSLPSLVFLKTFEIEQVNMSHVGMAQIAKNLQRCKAIQNINLSNNEIGEGGALMLANLLAEKRHLQILNVSHCFSATCEGGGRFMLELSKCTELQEIYIDSICLDDSSLHILCQGFPQMKSLQKLILSNNNITYQGILSLAEHLGTITSIATIDLSHNHIGPSGGINLADALRKCELMEELILAGNNLGDDTFVQLGEVLPHMKKLKCVDLQSCHVGSSGGSAVAQALASCQQIEFISLSDNTLDESCLLTLSEGLPQFQLLKQLHLKCCGISDSICISLAAAIGSCQSLEELVLSWNNIGDEGASTLAFGLKQMRKLQRLDLEKNVIQARGAEAIVQELGICLWIEIV